MISLGRRWDGVERDCEWRDGCRVRWANGLGWIRVCSPLVRPFEPQNGSSGRIDPFGSRRGVRSGSEFEFGLGGGRAGAIGGGRADTRTCRSLRAAVSAFRPQSRWARRAGVFCRIRFRGAVSGVCTAVSANGFTAVCPAVGLKESSGAAAASAAAPWQSAALTTDKIAMGVGSDLRIFPKKRPQFRARRYFGCNDLRPNPEGGPRWKIRRI